MAPPLSRFLRGLAALALSATPLLTQAPPGYYGSVNPASAATLRSTLHALIDDHVRIPYTASATDTWDVLNAACEDPTSATRILDLYKNTSLAKQSGGNSFYNREHTWPNSYGFPVDGGCNYPYTDCHMLFLCDIRYDTDRGNAPYRSCSGCQEFTTVANAGVGGGGRSVPGQLQLGQRLHDHEQLGSLECAPRRCRPRDPVRGRAL